VTSSTPSADFAVNQIHSNSLKAPTRAGSLAFVDFAEGAMMGKGPKADDGGWSAKEGGCKRE